MLLFQSVQKASSISFKPETPEWYAWQVNLAGKTIIPMLKEMKNILGNAELPDKVRSDILNNSRPPLREQVGYLYYNLKQVKNPPQQIKDAVSYLEELRAKLDNKGMGFTAAKGTASAAIPDSTFGKFMKGDSATVAKLKTHYVPSINLDAAIANITKISSDVRIAGNSIGLTEEMQAEAKALGENRATVLAEKKVERIKPPEIKKKEEKAPEIVQKKVKQVKQQPVAVETPVEEKKADLSKMTAKTIPLDMLGLRQFGESYSQSSKSDFRDRKEYTPAELNTILINTINYAKKQGWIDGDCSIASMTVDSLSPDQYTLVKALFGTALIMGETATRKVFEPISGLSASEALVALYDPSAKESFIATRMPESLPNLKVSGASVKFWTRHYQGIVGGAEAKEERKAGSALPQTLEQLVDASGAVANALHYRNSGVGKKRSEEETEELMKFIKGVVVEKDNVLSAIAQFDRMKAGPQEAKGTPREEKKPEPAKVEKPIVKEKVDMTIDEKAEPVATPPRSYPTYPENKYKLDKELRPPRQMQSLSVPTITPAPGQVIGPSSANAGAAEKAAGAYKYNNELNNKGFSWAHDILAKHYGELYSELESRGVADPEKAIVEFVETSKKRIGMQLRDQSVNGLADYIQGKYTAGAPTKLPKDKPVPTITPAPVVAAPESVKVKITPMPAQQDSQKVVVGKILGGGAPADTPYVKTAVPDSQKVEIKSPIAEEKVTNVFTANPELGGELKPPEGCEWMAKYGANKGVVNAYNELGATAQERSAKLRGIMENLDAEMYMSGNAETLVGILKGIQ